MTTSRGRTSGSVREIDYTCLPTLAHVPAYHAAHEPDGIAMKFEGRETTWAGLADRADRVAQALIAAGVQQGDRVLFTGKASDEFFQLLFGTVRIGAVLVPTQWRLATAEINQLIADSGTRHIFAAPDRFDDIAEFSRQPGVELVVAMETGTNGVPRFADWRDNAPELALPDLPAPDTVALHLYTSGTTGTPKAVMHSHATILSVRQAWMEQGLRWRNWQPGDVNLLTLPLGHVGGLGNALIGMHSGATTVIHREFQPAAVLDAIAHERVTKLFAVPTALLALLQQPNVRDIDYSDLRFIQYGAAPIAFDLLREATEVFGCGFAQAYGMTETFGTVVYLPPEDHDPQGTPRMRSAGIPALHVDLRVVDPQTRAPLAHGEVGEVEIRSPTNMVGYWNRPKETAETLLPGGWVRTGDAGYLDADGYLYIHDRFKDMIVSGAENIYPAEVESAIYGCPGVVEVAVIGVPDEKWGEAVKAVVVPDKDAVPTEADIIAFARTRIAPFKLPKSVDFVEELPKNPSGKLLRRELRAPYWTGRERQVN